MDARLLALCISRLLLGSWDVGDCSLRGRALDAALLGPLRPRLPLVSGLLGPARRLLWGVNYGYG
jgi:hypothetical protein